MPKHTKYNLLSAIHPISDYYEQCQKYNRKPSRHFEVVDEVIGTSLETLEVENYLQQKTAFDHLSKVANMDNLELLAGMFNASFDVDKSDENTLLVGYDIERQRFEKALSDEDIKAIAYVEYYSMLWTQFNGLHRIKAILNDKGLGQMMDEKLDVRGTKGKVGRESMNERLKKIVRKLGNYSPVSDERLEKTKRYFGLPCPSDMQEIEELESFIIQ